MFKQNFDDIFKDLPNEFGIVDDIFFAGYDTNGSDHDKTLKTSNADMLVTKFRTK